jgi:CCR4-NOT transcriptional complex subunit CAF120
MMLGQDTTRDSPHGHLRNAVSLVSSRETSRPPRTSIFLYDGQRREIGVNRFSSSTAVTQAFAVYPERPELISSRALIKLEGTCCDEEVCGREAVRRLDATDA